MPLPTTKVDFLDPFATLTFAAAHTKTVRLGTGICLVPRAQSRRHREGGGDARLSSPAAASTSASASGGWRRSSAPSACPGRAARPHCGNTRGDEAAVDRGRAGVRRRVLRLPKVCCFRSRCRSRTRRSCSAARARRRCGGSRKWATDGSESTLHLTTRRPRSSACGSMHRRPAVIRESYTSRPLPASARRCRENQVKRYRDAGVHQVIVGSIPRDPKTVQGDIERLAEQIVAPAAKL